MWIVWYDIFNQTMIIYLEFEFVKFDFRLSKFKFQKELYKITLRKSFSIIFFVKMKYLA